MSKKLEPFKPDNLFEQDIYNYLLKWHEWDDLHIKFEDRKAYRKLTPQERKIAYDKFTAKHPKPIKPKFLNFSLFDTRMIRNLEVKLRAGYWSTPNIILVQSEDYEPYVYLAETCEDNPKIARKIIENGIDWFTVDLEDEPQKPETTPTEVLEKLAHENRALIETREERLVQDYKQAIQHYNKTKQYKEMFDKYKTDDEAACWLIRNHENPREYRISIHLPEKVD